MKLILIALSLIVIYRFICFYIIDVKKRDRSKKYFYYFLLYLVFFWVVMYVFKTQFTKSFNIVFFIKISLRLWNFIKPYINEFYLYFVSVAGFGILTELFFKSYLTKKVVVHGPEFNNTLKNGILVGKFRAEVIPSHIRKFVPETSKDVFIPYNRLSRGITILGDMGCGKSRLMSIIHENIKERYPKKPILIHDPKGEWFRTYYNPETDLIFAPFDKRSISWDLWEDFKKHPMLKHPVISTAIAGHHSGSVTDRYWTDAGINLLKDVCKESSLEDAKDKLLRLKEDNSSDKTFLSTYSTSMIGFRDIATIELMNRSSENSGSVDELLNWDGRIFLLNNPSIASEQHGALSLLLSAFMLRVLGGADVNEDDIVATVILDEALTFQFPEDVEKPVFTQSRSKGLCVVASAQRLPKKNERGAWSDHPSHILGMRVTDLDTRDNLTKRLGEIKYKEKKVSKTFGEKTSTSETEEQQKHQAMAPEDWGNLKNREFILFHENGITPGRVCDINTLQKDLNIIEYDERKDVTFFMEGL